MATESPDGDHHVLRDARQFLEDAVIVDRVAINIVEQGSFTSEDVSVAVAADVVLGGGAFVYVALSLCRVFVFWIVEMTGDPLTPEEAGRSGLDKCADDFPQLAVGAFFKLLLGPGDDGVEKVDDREAVAHNAGGHACSADNVQERSRFGLVGDLDRANEFLDAVVGREVALPHSPASARGKQVRGVERRPIGVHQQVAVVVDAGPRGIAAAAGDSVDVDRRRHVDLLFHRQFVVGVPCSFVAWAQAAENEAGLLDVLFF